MCSHSLGSHGLDICLINSTAILLQEEGGTPIVSAFGEIDLHTVQELDTLMLRAISESGGGGSVIVDLGGSVIVDLGGTEFMDCSGLSVLIRGQSVLDDSGGALAVVCGERIGRVFEAAGLVEDFRLYEDLGSAVERCRGLRRVS